MQKTNFILWMVLGICLVSVEPAAAQYHGQTSFGFGGVFVIPTEADIHAGAGFSGDMEYYLSHRWSAAVDAAMLWSSKDGRNLKHKYVGGRVGYHWDMGHWHPLFEGGINFYRVDWRPAKNASFIHDTALGVQIGLGLEYFFQPTVSFRFTIEGHDVFSDLDASFVALGAKARFYF